MASKYARIFSSESSPFFDSSPGLTRIFLHSQEVYLNYQLHQQRHLFLNEVYDTLGLKRTNDGAIVGWILSDEDAPGEEYVQIILNEADGGIFELDFNVQGVIHGKLPEPKRYRIHNANFDGVYEAENPQNALDRWAREHPNEALNTIFMEEV